MTKKSLEIHSENILPIIKKWLYSDKDIFVRELVSNACDAIQKVKILSDRNEIKANDVTFRIDLKIDQQAKTLEFSDNGIGMNDEEVQKYIAQIAFSGAEDFVQKYQSTEEKDQFIGHFGLGFYSAYMVASKVEINTLSYKEGSKPVFWSCDGSSEYTIEEGTKTTAGTTITLFIDKDSEEFLEVAKIKQILNQYCSFLPYPVYLNDEQINTVEPLWIKAPSECTDEDYLTFYRHLYPMNEDPLFWIHLNVDYPFNLKGILYFPKLKKNYDLDKNTVKLYCNRVYVSDNCKDLIPNYLMALEGMIDSPDIPLNVSRSYLQMDRTVRQLSSHISKKVSDSLSSLYKNDYDRFIKCWKDVSFIVKLGVLEDEKFYDRVKDFLVWQSIKGPWMTIKTYMENNEGKIKDKVIYTRDEKHLPHIVNTYNEKGIDILIANSPIDQYIIQNLERNLKPLHFQRIDGAIDENIVDLERENIIQDESGKTESSHLAEFVAAKLLDQHIDVVAKSLHNDALPGFIMMDENQRRMRDYFSQLNPGESKNELFGKSTYVINTNNPLMKAIQKLDAKNPELAKDLILQTYELSLLSQHEMNPNLLNEFVIRSNNVLSKLTEQLTKE